MPRRVSIIIPAHRSERVVTQLKAMSGLLSLVVQRDAALHPRGDLITAELKEDDVHELFRWLQREGLGRDSSVSVTSQEVASMVSPKATRVTAEDPSEAVWEEMAASIAKESNMTRNSLALMAIAGIVSAVGIATNALHLVVGAMVIAPGFEPLTRIAFGAVNRNSEWRRGLTQTFTGYLAVTAGAAIATLYMFFTGTSPVPGTGSYLPSGALLTYWTDITPASLIVALVASIAGAIVIATLRSILTAGVMIALALIPSASIIGMGLILGEWQLMSKGLLRWLIDALFVMTASFVVLQIKRSRVQKRVMGEIE